MGVVGTGYPHPAEDWGAPGAVWQQRGPRLTSRWQSSSSWGGFSWSGFSWSCSGTGGAQPSPAPGAGPVRPTEGRGGRRALPQSCQMGKLRHAGAASGDQPQECRRLQPLPAVPARLLCAFPTPQLRAGTSRENPGAEQTKGASSPGLRETRARYRAGEPRVAGAGESRMPRAAWRTPVPREKHPAQPEAMAGPVTVNVSLRGCCVPTHHPQQNDLPQVAEPWGHSRMN